MKKRIKLVTDGQSIAPKPGDVVQHYKGGLYIVLMIARDEETQEERVIYTECKEPGRGRRPRGRDRSMSSWVSRPKLIGSRHAPPRYMEVRRG